MWFVVGLIVGGSILMLTIWLRKNKIGTRWYDWVIGLAGLALLLFAIRNYYGSQSETEPMAANVFLLVTGLPGLVLMVIAWQLISRRACRDHRKLCSRSHDG